MIERTSVRGSKCGAALRACERHCHSRKVDDFIPSRTRHPRTLARHSAKNLLVPVLARIDVGDERVRVVHLQRYTDGGIAVVLDIDAVWPPDVSLVRVA